MTAASKVQLGCGPGPLAPGWIHVDGSWNARLAKHPRIQAVAARLAGNAATDPVHRWDRAVLCHDLRKPLPFARDSVGAIYSSHVLEHLYAIDAERLLRECRRVLCRGGILRIVLPDLKAIVERYVRHAGNGRADEAADELMRALHMREAAGAPRNPLRRAYTAFFDFHSHKWMYDAASLRVRLEELDFASVHECACHDSAIDGIEQVERADRIDDGQGFCLECSKL